MQTIKNITVNVDNNQVSVMVIDSEAHHPCGTSYVNHEKIVKQMNGGTCLDFIMKNGFEAYNEICKKAKNLV